MDVASGKIKGKGRVEQCEPSFLFARNDRSLKRSLLTLESEEAVSSAPPDDGEMHTSRGAASIFEFFGFFRL